MLKLLYLLGPESVDRAKYDLCLTLLSGFALSVYRRRGAHFSSKYVPVCRLGSIWYLASVLVLPILFSVYFYTRKQQLETSLLVAGLALSFSILIFDLTEQYLQDSAAGLLVLGFADIQLVRSYYRSADQAVAQEPVFGHSIGSGRVDCWCDLGHAVADLLEKFFDSDGNHFYRSRLVVDS